MKRILLLGVIILLLTGCNNKEVKKETRITENNGKLSYTIDGEKTDIKPTKEEGYIVNKIICDNGSDIMWDNDNWEVEFTKINNKDRCKVDFTKDATKEGYRVTVTSNNTSSLDSLSKVTTENGTIKIYSKSKIKNVTGCNGVIENNKVIISNVTSNQTCNITVQQTLADTIKKAYPSSGARSSFNATYTTTALHTATDYDSDGKFSGTTYYFTGNPNNWVSFAGKKWRIIRINGNGSVRLLYAGTGSTDGYINSTTYQYNSSYDHPSYVGWKYNTSGTNGRGDKESPMYQTVNSWYTTNITNKELTNYINTEAIYCNDRSIGSGSYSISSTFQYAAYQRLVNSKNPTLQCSNTADKFSTFGLMTADEVVYAGGLWQANNSNTYYYLNASGGSATGSVFWWTMSPSFWSGSNAEVFLVFGSGSYSGYLHHNGVIASGAVRPVISLNKEVLVTGGDGSGNNPYTVTLP